MTWPVLTACQHGPVSTRVEGSLIVNVSSAFVLKQCESGMQVSIMVVPS